MKKSNENPHINCDDIEQLLIKKSIDELTEDENLLVEEHLKSCDRCQSYQNTLLSLQHSIKTGVEEKLIPDPAIRQNVTQRMKTLKPVGIGIFAKGWHYIRSIFEYRIPVYQALFSVVLIGLIFFGATQISFSPVQKPAEPQAVAQMETPIPAQMSVIDNLDIIEHQKIGRNAREDTTLTRFIVSTM